MKPQNHDDIGTPTLCVLGALLWLGYAVLRLSDIAREWRYGVNK